MSPTQQPKLTFPPFIIIILSITTIIFLLIILHFPINDISRSIPFWTTLFAFAIILFIVDYKQQQQLLLSETNNRTTTTATTQLDIPLLALSTENNITPKTITTTTITTTFGPVSPPPPLPPILITTTNSLTYETAEIRSRRSLTPAQISITLHLLDKLKSDHDFQPDHCTMALSFVNAKRFLKARNFNVQKAETLWRSAVTWRKSFHVSERRARIIKSLQTPNKDARADFIHKHWMSWTPEHLHDQYGLRYHIFRAGTSDPAGLVREMGGNLDIFIENFIRVLETALEYAYEIGEEDRGIVELNDLREFPDEAPYYFHRAYSSVPGFAANTKILDNYYPERLRRVFIIGPPRVFGVVWKLVLPFVPPDTKKKLFWFNPNQQQEWVEKIGEDIPSNQLPQYIGGTAPNDEVKFGGYIPVDSFIEYEKQFLNIKPLMRIGVIADVQHCDHDDGPNFRKTRIRRYRGALTGLQRALDDWLQVGNVDVIAQLGDVIDGTAKRIGDTDRALQRILTQFNRLPKEIPILHLIGNHELYNLNREELSKKLLISSNGIVVVGGKSFAVTKNNSPCRLIALDAYETAVIGYSDQNHPHYQTGAQILDTRNPNPWRSSSDWLKNVTGLDRRFVPYNGGVSKQQLIWLENELKLAVENNQFVIVLTHVPLGIGSASSSCLLWNHDEVMSICSKFATSRYFGKAGLVAVFAGHDHKGGFSIDDDGIYHVTFPSPLEADDCLAHAIVDIYQDVFVIRGSGAVQSRKLKIFTSQEEARKSRELFVARELDEFFYTCRRTGFNHRTKEECEKEFWKRGGTWDALAHEEEGWPRRWDD
jgi:manganese-dependent ADP-ribose/CDP-alcohol diphosphatase